MASDDADNMDTAERTIAEYAGFAPHMSGLVMPVPGAIGEEELRTVIIG